MKNSEFYAPNSFINLSFEVLNSIGPLHCFLHFIISTTFCLIQIFDLILGCKQSNLSLLQNKQDVPIEFIVVHKILDCESCHLRSPTLSHIVHLSLTFPSHTFMHALKSLPKLFALTLKRESFSLLCFLYKWMLP